MAQNSRFIRLSEVLRRTGYSKAWIYRLLKEKSFSQSVKIGVRSIAFIESEIDEWVIIVSPNLVMPANLNQSNRNQTHILCL
ncbi:Prophage CP4-57 regulatory protein (AlpA) [compost metagenome]